MYKERILNLLRSSKTGFVSGEALSLKMGISRTMVWKHVKSLEREGFVIEAVPSRGYRITQIPDLLRVADIRQGLKTKSIGRHMTLLPETASTNTVAMDLAAKGAPEGTVVLAEMQTGGKGRLGRRWISPKGNLYLSVILRPAIPTHKAPLITLMGAVAAASAIRNTCGLSASIKWPNDILLSGKKVSGLLTEMSAETDRIRHIVLGIGVNVNMDLAGIPDDIRALTTTVAAEAGTPVNRITLLRQLLRGIEQWYQAFLRDEREVLNQWDSLNVTSGNRVVVSGQGVTFSGLAQGIDAEGRLKVQLADGAVRTVAAGDVTIVKK
jgi:BirA family biotin operon repressor/biotin-[acetyl-CoA-carboxylase] ligase